MKTYLARTSPRWPTDDWSPTHTVSVDKHGKLLLRSLHAQRQQQQKWENQQDAVVFGGSVRLHKEGTDHGLVLSSGIPHSNLNDIRYATSQIVIRCQMWLIAVKNWLEAFMDDKRQCDCLKTWHCLLQYLVSPQGGASEFSESNQIPS